MFECIYNQVDASTEQAHDEQDLDAQQLAAMSALFTAFLTFCGIGVSIGGLYFIWRSLEQAREHSHIELRAYLRFAKCRLRKIADGEWRLGGLIVNRGHTPVTVRFLTEEHVRRFPIEREPPLPDYGSLDRYGATIPIGPESERTFDGSAPKLDEYWEAEIRAGRACVLSRQQLEYTTFAEESVRVERDLYATGPRFDKRNGMKTLLPHHYADSEWQQWLRSQEEAKGGEA